ncbi:MAG: tRNA (guanosine(37)-N1)-methyltransferase TrmD [Nitrospirae bacterium]|nr:MAG: tRNA (guanosine(37)-N1)-methyltransferase TrmD [Nitrospirota bacterium]
MNCSVVTIFPEVINAYLGASIMKRAIAKGLLTVNVHDLRAYTSDKHHTVDDYPYGGGAGMVMKPEPFFRITEELWPDRATRKIILLSPTGRKFDQNCAEELLGEEKELVFFCGRYEAIDERVHQYLADEEISVGDYVLTGGELPSLVIIDAVTRLIPGALGDCRSAEADSFSSGLLDYPHYTRPEIFSGKEVPPVLLSGNHSEVSRWRKKQALKATLMKRPDLFDTYTLSEDDMKLLDEIKEEN